MIRTKIACAMKLIDIKITELQLCQRVINAYNDDDEFDAATMEAIMDALDMLEETAAEVALRSNNLRSIVKVKSYEEEYK